MTNNISKIRLNVIQLLIMLLPKVLSKCGSFAFFNSLMQVPANIVDIAGIAQVTLENNLQSSILGYSVIALSLGKNNPSCLKMKSPI